LINVPLKTPYNPSQNLPPPPPPSIKIGIMYHNIQSDEDDFLSYLKRPLTARVLTKIIIGKKSVNFTKFDGMQDHKMHVHKFHEEAMEYMHDQDFLANLFSHSMKDKALKWYF